MKMKNLVAYAMLALGAVAAPFAGHADVAGGDIYSVDLSTKFGGVIPAPGTTLTIGESVTVRVRLVNRMNSENVPLDWRFIENGSWTGGSDPTSAYFAPQFGLMLGGQQVFADYLGSEQTAVGSKNMFTDLYFNYTVKAGDLALPARFMTVEGKAVSGDDDATDYALHFCNYLGAYWKLTNNNADSCVFHFCSDPLIPNPDPTWEAGEPHRYITGTGLGINVKTVDFDTNYFEPPAAIGEEGIWRQIDRGSTRALPAVPTVKVDGYADVAATMYVWVENPDPANPVAQVRAADNPELIDGRWVIKVPIAKGAQSATFYLQGMANGEAKVRMSASRELSYTKGGDIIEDWVERVVRVVDPPEPFVQVETLNMAGDPQTEFTCSTDYKSPVGMFRITLSQSSTSKVTATLVPSEDIIPEDVNERRIGISTSSEKADMPWLDRTLSVDFEPGETMKTLYVYALDRTSDYDGKIEFAPALSGAGAAEYTGEPISGYIFINGIKPVVTSPLADDELDPAMLGVTYTLDVAVDDSYRNLRQEGEWAVKIRSNALGDTKWHDFTDLTVDLDFGNTISVDIDFEQLGDDQMLELKVVDPDGVSSDSVKVKISVSEGKVANATPDRGADEYAESGELTAKVYFSLTAPNGKNVYAFLNPLNDDARNKVSTPQLAATGNNGVLITAGKTDSETRCATVTLLDGDASALFEVVLCSQQAYSNSKKVTSYTPGQCTINITNVVPGITAVYMGGQTIKTSGGVTKAVAQNVEKTFRLAVNEPGQLDLEAAGDDAFLTQWKFGTGDWEDMPGNPNLSTTQIKHTFSSPGDQEVTVRCQDKDMRKLGKWSAEFTFTVPVLDIPKVIITPVQDRKRYYEDETGSDYAFKVDLTAAPEIAGGSTRLNVEIKKEILGDASKYSVDDLVLSVDSVTFAGGVATGPQFFLRQLDGTAESAGAGFRIVAHVTNPEIDVEGKTWDDGEIEIYIDNRDPKIVSPSEKLDKDGNPIATVTTLGTENSLSWSLSDVVADKKGMSVTWETSEGQRKTYKQGDPGWDDVMSGTHTFSFSSAGEKSITISIQDKDGGTDSRTFYYTISPSKTLKLIPHGPTAGKGTPHSKRYRTASGLGEGRVWAENVAQVVGFESRFNCGLEKNWTVYGYGYKVGESSGSVAQYPARENKIDADGNLNAAGGYAYPDPVKDSFLYTWIQVYRKGGSGTDSGSVYEDSCLNGSTAPEYPEVKDVGVDVVLPTQAAEDGTYDDTILEAVFSKEFLPTDNMGDINQDGIPDAAVDKYGFGIVDESGKLTGDDLKKQNGFNDDEDYIPSTETSLYSSLIPQLPESWKEFGTPFSARLELRGYHDGLNDAFDGTLSDGMANPCAITGVKPDRVYLDPDTDPNSTLSKVEFLAFIDQGGSTNDVSTWAKWSPERPTDPTLADTDDDGFTDGYEYFFWYRAHVGYMENGQHKYMTGRRYDPTHPAETNVITSAEIAALFDPLAASGDASAAATRDTDNDGLPDLLEFTLGTNPVDCDTDGDGLPDGYEVMIGTDPLLWATDKSTCDADLNPDGDWMANEKVEKQQVFGLDDGNGGVDYYTFGKTGPGDPERAEAINGAVKYLQWRDKDGKADTNNFWITTEEVRYRTVEINGTNYFYLTKALTSKGTWRGYRTKLETTAAGLPVCGEPVNLPVGWRFDILQETNEEGGELQAFNVYYGFPASPDDEVRYWRVWHYGRDLTKDKDPKKASNLVFGQEFNHASKQGLGQRALRVQPFEKTIHRLHYHVYQDGGYDPRTAWKGEGSVKTTAFTHLDEFYTLAFFVNDGVLPAAELVPTKENPWTVLWEKFSTSPLKADTDEDAMPDGWELYVMGGPKQYVEKADDPNYHERIVDYGPRWKYSPLISFNLLTDPNDRDNDKDKLEWPDEYMGTESGAQYPDCATIAAPYETWKARGWRNKKWPTDPWNEDTDGDGLTDGEEEAKVFIYGDPAATGTAGGGLDPLSWDTDGDFLPDPWELEFAGHYVEGASTNKTEVAVSEDKSTTNTVKTTLTAPGYWEGGMDGTVADAYLDYDYDGLDNWQEYMTGAMRCWRYDDTVSPWTNLEDPYDYIPDPSDEEAWNEFWYGTLVDEQSALFNPHCVGGTYDNGAGWFSLCTNAWDGAKGFWFMFKDGVYHDLRLPPARYIIGEGENKKIFNRFTYRVYQMSMATGDPWFFWINGVNNDYRVYPEKYVCCDPTMHDTDLDGMDDYYELFHGLNPLLGQNKGDHGAPRPPQDVVYRAYGGDAALVDPPIWSANNNYWMQYGRFDGDHPMAHPKPRTKGNDMDFEIYPWLNGLAHADPDGDNIPNQQEAILANVQAAASYLHTDPTPLWMTDTDYANSLTWRYFRDPLAAGWIISGVPDGFKHVDPVTGVTNEYKFADFPLFSYDEKLMALVKDVYSLSLDIWDVMDYFWSFEENEGYDSDHDYLSDFEEAQGKTKPASDPQNSDDPLRRQAMYFGGEASPGLLQTPLAHAEQVPYAEVASESRQNFLYYTAECWVKAEDVDPDKGLQTILERTIQCTSENPADENLTRRNFLLGVRNGRWYTKFDSTGTDANQPVEITDGPQATTNWTHLAATYDGTALRLYVDGVCNNRKDTSIQPEHGISAVVVNDCAEQITSSGQGSVTYDNLGYPLISILVGASAVGERGIVMDYNPRVNPLAPPTTVADYTGFFKGYVDEIRIWDGARPASDIRSDYQNKTRYNAALAAENRQVVYSNWRTGARRTPVSAAQLPAQLMYHFTFDHLPGAVRAADVLRSPAGFVTATTVTDAKAIWSRPEGWVQSWWYGTLANLRSTVYAKAKKDCAWVPWIANTVAHLPRFDGTTLDSVYWSETYAGAMTAAEAGYPRFAFPRNHEVASKWRQMTYNTAASPWSMHSHADFLASIDGEDGELTSAYRFSMRDRKTEGDDLLPLLNAFPKRISAAEGGMWDDQGAADAWAQTGQDSNNDSLPDWWQAYARANYCKDIDPRQTLTWDTTVTYHGVQMPAWQAYLRDLAAGMLPGGKIDENYADTRDFDADGMPDWWEEQNKVQGYSQADADADPDNDGLSNYAEYLLGEVYPFVYGLPALDPEGYKQPKLDPQHAYSTVGQRVVDYFQSFSTNHIKVTTGAKTHFWLDEYFGEIATDHDFMEDWWENAFKNSYVSSKVYDPLDDKDEDGWSNWAECRASLWGGYFNAALIDSWTGSDSSQHVVCYPEPILGVRATYHGLQDISGHQLVIRTLTGQTPRVDATFVVPPTLDAQTRYIGPFRGDYAFHGHLSPGQLNANSIVFERAQTSSDKNYTWNFDWYIENEGWSESDRTHTGSFEQYRSEFARWPKIELEGGDLVWESFATAQELTPGTATVMLNGVAFGTVNCTTGEFELDMAKFDTDFSSYVFRVTYTSRIGHEWPQAVYVSDTKELASGTGTGGLGNGRMREGRTTIEAFLDLNGDGLYTEGEPFGSARNVMVGWHKVPEITIELKDESPIMPCIEVGGAAGGDGSPASASLTKTIKVFREAINEYPAERTLATKTVVVDDHPYITELDVSTAAKPDLDWTWLLKDAAKIAAKHEEFAAVESAVYRVDELVTVDGVTVTNTLKRFVKEFPKSRPTAAAISPVGSAAVPAPVSSASPTFSFSVNDTKATGYRLQVRKAGATSPVYDSGIALLPGRGGATVGAAACEVTPPVYVGAPVYSGTTTNREVFADGTNYQWRVALYDAKYNSTTDDSDLSAEWSAWANFEMDVCNSNRYPRLATGYGAVTAAVRYYGPATNDLRGKIVVEAFENADFRGQPLAQVRVSDLAELRSLNEPGAGNAVLRGIRPGTVFLRAFIDQNDNGSRDKWESWGYANMVGQGFKAIYNPDPYAVTVSTADWIVGKKADRVIYIEDCDANKNEQPDCLEPELFPEDVSSDVEETESIDWWEWAEADPDDVTEGDVMAYREVTMKLVTLWDGVDANVLKSYLLCGDQATPVAGNDAANYAFMTAWEYGTLTACGVPVPAADLAGLKVYETPKDVKVALIHAQVRETYGFCSDTAVPGGKTDTKAFTAQDKYFVLRYLEQTGRLAEPVPEGYKSFEDYVMNSGNVKLYEKYCLKPNVIDNDHDGIADGFELYIDSRPLDASDRESDWDGDGVPLWREFELDPDTGLAHATDPRKIDTDGDGITDKDFHDYLLWDAGGDFDGDGLSNYAEYLITCVFKAAQLDPRNPKTDGYCVDYFRKMGELYFGEIFTDHDQVNDVWEGVHSDAANRYVYDPNRDDDGDGWSNWAEAKAGTDPETEADVGIDGYVLAAYPVPYIETLLTYSGANVGSGSVVIKAWSQKSDPEMTGAADAIWHLGGVANAEKDSTAANTSEKYVGLKPDGVRTFNLGPGAIQHGTVRICYKDLSYCKVKLDQYGEIVDSTIGDPDSATWYFMAQDREGVLYTVGGIFADEQVVGSVDYETGKVTVNFNAQYMTGLQLGDPTWAVETEGGTKGGSTKDEARTYDLLNLDQSYVLVTWSSCTTLGSFNRKLYLSDADSNASGVGYGHVREGLNTFIAFADSDGNGEYTPGEPFGIARDVDVGWDGAKLEIDLTETSAITPRANLWTGESDRLNAVNEALQASALNDPLLKVWLTNEEMRVWYAGVLSNRVALVNPPDAGERTRVRIVRYGVDDMYCYRAGVYGDQYQQRAVLDKTFDPNGRDFLCEADFLSDGQFDIDWTYLRDEVVNASGAAQAGLEVSNMTYLVVIGDGPTSFRGSKDTNTTVNALATMVTRRFEVVRHLPVAENVEGIVYGARPTFRWSIPDEESWAKAYGTSYTAFKLQILKEDGKTVVYDSGVRRLPPQAKDGSFTWMADAFVGDQTALGQIFGAAGQWTWRVAMYNAKFKPLASRSEKWSNLVPFATAVGTQQETDDHGYSSVDVSVKYTGPALVLDTAGFVRVQAFETADFSGTPAAQISVTDINSVKDATDIRKNCTLIGLKPGTYYIRAYIDSNGNFKKDDWESWGAAKEPAIVKPNQLAPIVGLYIEDADTDQDWLPDAWEMAKYGNLATKGAEIDPTGKIVLKTEIFEDLANGTANISRFLSGASLTFFQNIGNVSLALGLDDVTEKSIAEIRAMVEKNIDPDSVKITSLVVDPGNGSNGKVILTVAAKATDSIAGYLISPIYELPKSTDVTINIYRKDNLATDQWTFVKAVSKTIESTLEARVEVPIEGVDFNSGFYKVEIVQ